MASEGKNNANFSFLSQEKLDSSFGNDTLVLTEVLISLKYELLMDIRNIELAVNDRNEVRVLNLLRKIKPALDVIANQIFMNEFSKFELDVDSGSESALIKEFKMFKTRALGLIEEVDVYLLRLKIEVADL
ncbi:MAG: hypothetical protein KDC83_11750 [Flavobacteriales bacterium]|nr:hypothetical protein [Flavobacteriales bacterium]